MKALTCHPSPVVRPSPEAHQRSSEEVHDADPTRRSAYFALSGRRFGAAVAGCGGETTTATARRRARDGGGAASDEPVTLTVGLFGTFGYKEAGLYDEYMELHPNITIKETSIELEQDYYQALQTHLAGGGGLSDIQGIEVGRIAEVTQTQADKWVDLRRSSEPTTSKTRSSRGSGQAATSPDGAVVGLGTDTGPQAICYRKDLFEQAGLPTDRERARRACGRLGRLHRGRASSTWKNAPKGSAFIDSASGLYNAIIGQSETQYYDEEGNPIYDTNPAVKDAWDIAVEASPGRADGEAQQFDQAWNQGFANGAFATIACPAWMIGYIKGQAGDAGDGQVGRRQHPGRRRQLGRLLPGHPGRQRAPGGGVRS